MNDNDAFKTFQHANPVIFDASRIIGEPQDRKSLLEYRLFQAFNAGMVEGRRLERHDLKQRADTMFRQ